MLIDPLVFVQQLVNFGILLAILTYVLYKPVSKYMQDRQQRIENELKDANARQEEIKELQSKSESLLEDARNEARKLLDDASRHAEEMKASILEEARQEADKIRERTLDELEAEKQQVWRELREQAADLSVTLAGKVLDGNIDPQNHRHLVDKFLHQLDELDISGENRPGAN